jgi:hypothetical protein
MAVAAMMSDRTTPPKRRPSAPDSARRTPRQLPKRGPGGRKPVKVEVYLGKDAMTTLHTFALARQMTVEALAARWLVERIDEEWERYDQQIQALVEEEFS